MLGKQSLPIVDVVREQERRARLQLLDEIREPSPQPIFGEPVKVELEDETSRRIKNTLGDFIGDPKNAISRTAGSSHRSSLGHKNHQSSKRPSALPNGLHKLHSSGLDRGQHSSSSHSKSSSDKRLYHQSSKNPSYSSSSSKTSSAGGPHASGASSKHSDKSRASGAREKDHRRTNSVPNVVDSTNASSIASDGASSVVSHNNVPAPAVNLSGGSSLPSLVQNGTLPNGLIRQQRHNEPLAKPSLPKLIIKQEKCTENIELETILREMKQAVPPPLTAIQTPKTEERGFAFPTDSREDSSYVKVEEQLVPQKSKCDDESKPSIASPNVRPPSPYNLQEDLEMSDSDDELAPEVKNSSADCKKSPAKTNMNLPTTVVAAASGGSSSSESCDSDSDESSSESNDSDSSVSSEASDVETPSKQPAPQMWGLSNFFDETRRNHSPAFIPIDTNTNSSTAVKEEPMSSVGLERNSFSLVDEDSVNGILGKYSDRGIKDYLRSPIANLLDLGNAPVNIKTEILSPIPSPVQSSPAPPAQAIRGPHTPPSPPLSIKEEDDDENGQNETSLLKNKSPKDLLHSSQNKAQSKIKSDLKEEKSKIQSEKGKKQQKVGRNKMDSFSPRIKSSPIQNLTNDTEFSSLKETGLLIKEKDIVASIPTTSSCSVPSETFQPNRDNSLSKSKHKHASSSSSKKNKASIQENINESNQKKTILKSQHDSSKEKHPVKNSKTAYNRANDKYASNISSSIKVEQIDEHRKHSKSIRKEKFSTNSEKTEDSNKKSHNKSLVKEHSKQKSKSIKRSPKHSSDTKNVETKKKKKFSIENFLQSPTFNHKNSDRISDGCPSLSPSPERSPIPEMQRSISPNQASRSPSRSSSKSIECVKINDQHGHTSQTSDRIPNDYSINQEDNRKSHKSFKSCDHNNSLPVRMQLPTQLLSPIPHESPKPNSISNSAIPSKIMVNIPLEKLFRLPSQPYNSHNKHFIKPKSSSSVQSSDASIHKTMPRDNSTIRDSLISKEKTKYENSSSRDKISKKEESKLIKGDDSSRDKISKRDESMSQDKTSKRDSSTKHSHSKDFKDKSRTESSKNRTSNKKDKNFKSLSESCVDSKSKVSTNVNNKNSIKIVVDKTHCDDKEVHLSKKRKNIDDDKQHSKKKAKAINSEEIKQLEHTSKKELAINQVELLPGKSKPLERCDSASSLSSLCSQQSQRSSKSSKVKNKDSSKNAPDSKRIKTSLSPLLSAKDIKQEKEEKPKVHIKKEPGLIPIQDKTKKPRERIKDIDKEFYWNDSHNTSSQYISSHWEEHCNDPKGELLTNQNLTNESLGRDPNSDWDHFAPEIHKELKEASSINKHSNQTHIMPMEYFWTEGTKQKRLAEKEKDPILQVLKYFEATVLFILTSQQREEYTKDPDSVYRFYKETLKFSSVIRSSVQKLISQYQHTNPGTTEFKLLILCLKCQSLLHVKLYNLKIKEIKEQQKPVSDWFRHQYPAIMNASRNPSHSPLHSRLSMVGGLSSPHSSLPSPSNSVGSQTSGYVSDLSANLIRNLQTPLHLVNIPQSILEMLYRQHMHLNSLHLGHDLWEQADMYMTRSNLREFFKEVADQSEHLTLHSSIKELVSYIQKGLYLVKNHNR